MIISLQILSVYIPNKFLNISKQSGLILIVTFAT